VIIAGDIARCPTLCIQLSTVERQAEKMLPHCTSVLLELLLVRANLYALAIVHFSL
jgi:hypothetical protein